MINISRLPVSLFKSNKYYDFGNDVLYNLCKQNFKHRKEEIIIAKVLFIGRIYAAAIERRKSNGEPKISNDKFYIKKVVPSFMNSRLDEHLEKLKSIKTLSTDNLQQVLEVHCYLTTILAKITHMEKRSFCSKYLHFHLPDMFYIYDSRAVAALKHFSNNISEEFVYLTKLKTVEAKYAKFFCKCISVKKQIEEDHQTILTNRQFDNLLMNIASKSQ